MAIDPNVAAQAVEHSTLYLRFAAALDLMETKLVNLVASAPLLLVAILIVLFSMWFGRFVARRMRVLTRISRSNPYMDGLLRGIVRGLIVLAGVLMALDLLDKTSLVTAVLGSAGVVGLVLGFAFKDIAENYVAGVLLSLRRPFAPGDTVRIDSYDGKVVSLNSRATVLMTFDGNHLQLPNSLVFKSVLLNFSRNPKRRFDFETRIGAATSWHTAMDTGLAALSAMDGVLADPAPNALIARVEDSGAVLQFLGWIDQTRNDLGKTRSEAMRHVRKALYEAGILPPDPVQKVMLLRESAGEPAHAAESALSRDTSVDRALDAQVGKARQTEDGNDLLETPAPPP
jgi:small-conductance mechanosensitive channel